MKKHSILAAFLLLVTGSVNADVTHPDDIHYSDSRSVAVFGLIDSAAANEYLSAYGLTAAEVAPGYGLANLVVADYGKVEGCNCPGTFRESYLMVLVSPFASSTRYPVTYAALYTDHVQRLVSMSAKYGAQYELAQVGFDFDSGSFSVETLTTTGGKDMVTSLVVDTSSFGEYKPAGVKLIAKTLGSLLTGPVEHLSDVTNMSASLPISDLSVSVTGDIVQYSSKNVLIDIGLRSTLGQLLAVKLKFIPTQIDFSKDIEAYQSKDGTLEP